MSDINVSNKNSQLHRVLDAVKEIKAKVEETGAAKDEIATRLDAIEARAEALDKALPTGEKIYIPEGNKSRQDAVRNFGGAFSQAYRKMRGMPLDEAYARTSQNEGTASEGGVLVPVEVLPDVVRIISEKSIARQICRVIPMTRDKMDVPTRSNGPAVAWFTEDSAITEDVSVVTFGTPQLDSETLTCLDSVSKDLDADAIVALEPVLAELFGEAFAKEENQQCFSSVTPFSGVVQKASNSVSIAGDHYSTVTFAELVEAKFSVDANVIGSGTWVMHPLVFQYIVSLTDDQGHPIYASNWASGWGDFNVPNVPQAVPGRLLGSPVFLSTTMPTGTTSGASFAVYGDFSKHAMGDRQSFQIEVSDDVYFAKRKRAILASERIAFQCLFPAAFTTLDIA